MESPRLLGNDSAAPAVVVSAIKKMSDSPGWTSGNRVPTRCLPVKIGCLSTDKRKHGFNPGATMFRITTRWAVPARENFPHHRAAIERSRT